MNGSSARRVSLFVVGLALALALAITPGPAGAQSQALANRIDSIVEDVREANNIPGMSVAVVLGGDTIVLKGYGYANLENDVPATPESVYQLASVSKQFTAVGILNLVERGKVNLDDPLTKYVPDHVTNGRPVTIHHLLTHTHGMQDYNRPETLDEWTRPLTHTRFLELMKDQPFDFPLGERYLYRNTGYYFAGMIIEQMSGNPRGSGGGDASIIGKPYGEALREVFFDPLGMTSTSECGNAPLIKHRAQGYALNNGEIEHTMLLDMSWPFAVGSLCSSVLDLLMWQDGLHGGQVLSPELYEQMITPATLNDGSKTEYGYGVGISDRQGHRVISHGGGTVGYSTYLSHYPDDRLTIVILTNLQGINVQAIEGQIARAVLGIREPIS
jgi:CubicO group peptidase (beta-lactamase class C family)